MKELGDVRNYIIHNSTENYTYPIYPSPDYNKLLKKIIMTIENPLTIYNSDMCIKNDGKKMYFRTLKDNVHETIEVMLKELYTHIPILENGKIIGVFSESSLIEIFKDIHIDAMDENTTFEDIFKYIDINKQRVMEDYQFIAQNENIYEVAEKFRSSFESNKRLSCLFITANGKSNEKVLGLTTIWDVLGNKSKL